MVPEEAFEDILFELERLPIKINSYRKKVGEGRSQAFGVVGKRGLPPDYSRQCWLRPYLYKLLLDFGNQYVTDISWNAITLTRTILQDLIMIATTEVIHILLPLAHTLAEN